METITHDFIEKLASQILIEKTGSENLLVTFGGINRGLGIPVFEFFNSLKEINCDKIFLRDFKQAWYHNGINEKINNIDYIRKSLQKIIRDNNYTKTCFLGNSMGGYAAILFGSMINVNTIISFSPQTFIDKWNRFLTFDTRWKKQLSYVYTYTNKKIKYFDLKKHLKTVPSFSGSITIYYCPKQRLDKIHAERLKGCAEITLVQINNGGHDVVKILRDTGELKSVITKVFEKTANSINIDTYNKTDSS